MPSKRYGTRSDRPKGEMAGKGTSVLSPPVLGLLRKEGLCVGYF